VAEGNQQQRGEIGDLGDPRGDHGPCLFMSLCCQDVNAVGNVAECFGGLGVHAKLLGKSFLFLKEREAESQVFSLPPNHPKGVRYKRKRITFF
jgi:hypothetical protein